MRRSPNIVTVGDTSEDYTGVVVAVEPRGVVFRFRDVRVSEDYEVFYSYRDAHREVGQL